MIAAPRPRHARRRGHRRSTGADRAAPRRIRCVGGVILFARNFESSAQIARADRVDPRAAHAGAADRRRPRRRPRAALSRRRSRAIPPMRTLGEHVGRDPAAANARGVAHRARRSPRELRAHGVDFSFTPVLDLDYGASAVIGDRAFHADPDASSPTSPARCCAGLRCRRHAPRVGKHFPGHGFVAADSHVDTAGRRSRARRHLAHATSCRSRALIQQASRRRSCRRTSSIPRSTRSPPASRASGSATSCADGSASTVSCSPTISGWRARIGGRHRRARGRGARCRMRHGARLQRLRRDGRAARAVVAAAAAATCATPAWSAESAGRATRTPVRVRPAAAEPARDLLGDVRHDGAELLDALVGQARRRTGERDRAQRLRVLVVDRRGDAARARAACSSSSNDQPRWRMTRTLAHIVSGDGDRVAGDARQVP